MLPQKHVFQSIKLIIQFIHSFIRSFIHSFIDIHFFLTLVFARAWLAIVSCVAAVVLACS